MPSVTMEQNEPIAVIGSGCRFPGSASTPSKLWDLLSQPRDVLTEIPRTRFDPHGFYHPDGEYGGHSNVLHSYILDEDHRTWDADFFNVSANEASAIDPQQRLLMECVYEALEAGGQRIPDLRGSDTAVYVGLMCEEYSDIQGRELNTIPTYFPTGTARSVVSNRISYFFDWRGASMTIDTACSSSLVAVHQGVQVLRSGASRVAVAAGTNLILGPEPYIAESTFHMLSPRGRSHMWDAGADGYGRGDGVAAVVLKRLSDAVADGDVIECVIRETGVNQDGRTNGITVPSADSQVALIQDTYRRAGLDLDSPSGRPQFFEAHGTGTLAGDPIEAEAISRAIGRRLGRDGSGEKLFVGSIKSVIGHTEGTAGIAGLLKVSLALQNGLIPPNMLFNRLNPAIEPFYRCLEVPVRATPWPATGGQPRRASVNSFGFGGTNAHAVVESYEPHRDLLTLATQTEQTRQSACVVPYTFSAASKASLKRMLKNAVDFLEVSASQISPHDLAYTLNTRRSTLPFRAAYSGTSLDNLRRRISDAIGAPDWETDAAAAARRPTGEPARILGIFTGQGAQWAGMGRQLLEDLPFARARLRELETALATLPAADRPPWSLRAELAEPDAARSRLHLAEFAQPLCTALQVVLVDLLAAANVRFAAVVGHSSGEIAAAYAAGVLSVRDAVVVAYYRGLYSSLARGAPGQKGAMLAVGTTRDDADEVVALPQFEGRLCVAACNSPASVTLSGDEDAVEEAKVMFEDEGKFARTLRVDKAYHSHHMKPCTIPYVEALRRASVEASRPRRGCKWYSSVLDGALITGDADGEQLDGMYWAHNMAQTVLFSTAVEAAVSSADTPFTLAIEVGPHGALRGPAQDTVAAATGKPVPAYVSSLSRNINSSEAFSSALGQIWTSSADGTVDLDRFQITAHGPAGRQRAPVRGLPAYPWDKSRVFWHESRRSRALRLRRTPGHPLLGTLIPDSTETDMAWHHVLRVADLPWLDGHRLQGQTVFPAAGYVALAVEAAVHLAANAVGEAGGKPAAAAAAAPSPKRIELRDLSIGRAIAFDGEKAGIETLFSLHIEDDMTDSAGERVITAGFRSRSVLGDATEAILNASGTILVSLGGQDLDNTPEPQDLLPPQEEAPPLMVQVDENEFYSALRNLGYQYSMTFRALQSMTRKMSHGRGRLSRPAPAGMHHSDKQLLIHPGLLDASFQAIFLAYSWPGDGRLWSLHVPVSIKSIRIDAVRCRAIADSHLSIDSAITMDGSVTGQAGIAGDVDIFTADGRQGLIQVEGIRVIPFAAASESQDTQMFFANVAGVAFPDGELAMRGALHRAPAEEMELGWLLERISHFYLARLAREITPDEEARAEWHHQKLMDFARHAARMVSEGRQPYGKKEWVHDTEESLGALMDGQKDKIEVRLMRSVGEHLAEAVRGETVILEHMLEDGMLNQYYVESLGLQPYTAFLAEVMGQITHVNPRLRVLEIGAGTGGATKGILRKIRDAFDHYTFTDISSGFFETARAVFSEHAAGGRMDFAVLDAEKDVLAQGFDEASYDLVVASLVLHATKDLGRTLRNVRRLLRPGGFLVMLEVTSNVTMRLSFTMGGLEGWWLGADSGRPWTPCVAAADWHALLLRAGFTGVEASTPELDTLPRPFGVLVSRAADDRVRLLLAPALADPSPLSAVPELVIVAGRSLRSVRLAQQTERILRPHCGAVTTVQTVEELGSGGVPLSTRLTVLYLADLDRPVFDGLTPEAFDGLKALFTHAQAVLWVTAGARAERPHANMSVGLGRAMAMEHSHMRLQFVDLADGARPDPHMLADDLLRLHVLSSARGEQDPGLLWSREPELVVDRDGRRWVSRIVPHVRFNASYNASRRTLAADAHPDREVVEIRDDDNDGGGGGGGGGGAEGAGRRRCLVRVPAPEARRAEADGVDTVRLRVLYSATTPLRHSSAQALYACIGIDDATGSTAVALSSRQGSIVEVPRRSTVPYKYPLTQAPTRLRAVAIELLASLICSETEAGAVTLLVEPDRDLAEVVTQWAQDKGLRIACATSSPAKRSAPFVFVHPRASSRAIRRALPSSIAQVIVFANATAEGDLLAKQIKTCLPGSPRTENAELFQARDSSSIPLTSLLEDAVSSDLATLPATEVVPVQDYVAKGQARSAVIVDWMSVDPLSVTVKPSDSLPLLRGDRTYLLVGLAGAGGLGLSLAEYLARQGARYIILTSRSPSVNDKLISSYASQGVKIEVMANDVTDEAALTNLVADVRSSPSWPPIAGVANGAMVLHDTTLQNMTFDQMMRVLRPKVEGTRILDAIFHHDPLDFFVLFSSLSCVFGREGQANYDAANMYLVGLAAQRRARGVCASVVDIGAVMGTGYMAREVSEQTLAQLVGAGYRKMSERDFHLAFANAVLVGRAGADKAESPELITGLYVPGPGEDFKPAWAQNARFAHVLRRRDGALGESAADSSQTESTQELLRRARTDGDVLRVLQAAVLIKLQNMLQLSSEIMSDHASLLQQTTGALGVDSLVAVEIRSWMLRELDVDIPVLKILSEATIQDMVDFAVEKLPEGLVPNLDPNAEDAITAESLAKPAAAAHKKPEKKPGSDKPPAPVSGMSDSIPSLSSSPNAESDGMSATEALLDSPAHPSKSSTASSVVSLSAGKATSKAAMDKVLPMSFGQSRFWLMSQVVPNPCAFNVTCDIEITAKMDKSALGNAVLLLGARHEALRTCFFNDVEDHHQPVQGILKDSPLHLETVDASATEVRRHFNELHKTVYDMGKGELMRIVLVTISPTLHHLLVGYHHINMDSSSLAVLVYDLQRLYAGQDPPLPRVQYSDFTLHQLERVRNGRWEKETAFWRAEFSNPPDPLPILDLSPNTNRPRPDLVPYEVISTKTRVEADVARQVRAASRKAGVTPFHLYATVLQVLLARLAGTEDICIGMADANRGDVGAAADSVGNFLNLLPLRLPTAPDQSFASLVKSTRDKILHAMANSALPFDVILEQVQPARSPSHSPLFQAFIDYRQVTEKLPWGSGQLEGKDYLLSKTPYDVMLDIIDTPTGEASLEMTVQDGLYTAEEAETLLGCYTNLLSAFTENSHLTVGEPSMFNEQEVERALRLGQGEVLELEHPSILPELDEIAASQPTSTALEDSIGNSLSWREMVSKSVAVAQALTRLHMPAGSRIGVFQDPKVDWIYSMLGIWRAGHAYVPLETSQGMRRLEDIARAAHLGAVVIHDSTMPLVSQLSLDDKMPIVNVSGLLPLPTYQAPRFPSVGLEDEAMVIYTSGSTGVPKGITIPHRVVVNALRGMLHRWPMHQPQTVLQQIAISFDLSWWGALLGLATRGKVVVAGREARGDPRALTRLIVSRGVTLTVAVPTETAAWLEAGDAGALRASSWAWHVAGGEPFGLGLARHLRRLDKAALRAVNVYGPTEIMIPAAHEVDYRAVAAGAASAVPIGRAMPNYAARVVDARGRPVPAGVPGHLVFGGAGIAAGYVDNPVLTAERFPADRLAPAAARARGWTTAHLSGDRGYMRPHDGALMLLARMDGDTQVKLRGLRLDVMDVEANIMSAAKGQVSDAVVHLRRPVLNDAGSDFLAAHVVLAPAAKASYRTPSERGAFLRQLVQELPLPSYMRPSAAVAVDVLPLTAHGKLDRRAIATWPLGNPAADNSAACSRQRRMNGSRDAVALSGSQGKVKDLWLSILGEAVHSHVLQADSDFFQVGGNSLLLIRVQGELRKQHGLDVSLANLFQRSTLAQMASLLDETDGGSPKSGPVGPSIDWEEEIRVPSDLADLRASSEPLPPSGLVVALTGAFGFLGRHILEQLIRMPEVETIHCIATRNSTTRAVPSSPKIKVHAGDLALHDLGMPADTVRAVFSTAHVVIHNGADTSFLKAYGTVRATNLGSTKTMVRHALRHGHVRRLHLVSTAGISTLLGRDLYEEPLGAAPPPPAAAEGYLLSKWAAELHVERAAAAAGLRATVHRPAAVVGPGAPPLDVMTNVLRFAEALRAVPAMAALRGSFQFVGVRDVARDIAADAVGRAPLPAGRGADWGRLAEEPLVRYRNHAGEPGDAVDVHRLGEYLGRQLGTAALPVFEDGEWISKAEAVGMGPEVAAYLRGMNLTDRKGEKWTFPMVWNRAR